MMVVNQYFQEQVVDGKKYKIELNPVCHQKIGVISKQNEV
jgi:hypothetical protein